MFTRSKDETKKTLPSGPVPVQKDAGAPSIISAGVEINGHITSPGEIQLDGSIDGDITCDAFSLGESGKVTGRIMASSVTIRGRIEGEICGSRVRLEKTANVTGDVTHETLSVEGGAKVSGQLIHKDNPLESVTPKAAAAPAAAQGAASSNGARTGSQNHPSSQGSGGKSDDSGRREAARNTESSQPNRAKASA